MMKNGISIQDPQAKTKAYIDKFSSQNDKLIHLVVQEKKNVRLCRHMLNEAKEGLKIKLKMLSDAIANDSDLDGADDDSDQEF